MDRVMEFDGGIIITDPCYIIRADRHGTKSLTDDNWGVCGYGDNMEVLGIRNYMTRDPHPPEPTEPGPDIPIDPENPDENGGDGTDGKDPPDTGDSDGDGESTDGGEDGDAEDGEPQR